MSFQKLYSLFIKHLRLLHVHDVSAIFDDVQEGAPVKGYNFSNTRQEHVIFTAHYVECRDVAVVKSKVLEERVNFCNQGKPTFELPLIELSCFEDE